MKIHFYIVNFLKTKPVLSPEPQKLTCKMFCFSTTIETPHLKVEWGWDGEYVLLL